MRHFRQSLSWKLSLGILLMAIPIFALALGILFEQSRNNIKSDATKHVTSMLNTTTEHFLRYMEMVETATNINDWEVIDKFDPDSIQIISHYIVALNGHIDGCSISMEPDVFPKYGRHFSVYTVREPDTVTTVIEKEYDYFDKIWYKKPHMLGKSCWAVYYDESDSLALTLDGMIASYNKPLYDANKRFVGVISTDLSLLRLSKTITKEVPYEDSYFIMTGEEGRFYLHPDTTKLFKNTIFSDANPAENSDIIALGHEMTTGKKGTMSVNIDGRACIVSYQAVPGTDWSLALICPEQSILSNYNRLSIIVTPLVGIGLLLVLLFSIFTVAHAIRPLNKLTRKIQKITAGDYDEQIKVSPYNDIVGRLQNTFATMQKSLSQHVSDIQHMNDETSKSNDELVRLSELAKTANHQKTLFIQHVSHQIRTPLNIIMGFAQVLKDSKSSLPEEEMKTITDMIKHNAQMLNRMVLMLSDCSAKGEMEELYKDKNEIVSCNDVAQECISYANEHFPEVNIKFKTDVSDDFSINSNHSLLMRSIRELLYNACKYSDGRNVLMHVTELGSMVRFIVEDTGTGIAEEDVCRLFEMFTKTNDLSEGLGIGLPLARRHIRNLNGDIILDKNYQGGCRFIIEISKI
ncbi:MAG: HAMP domain-containing protein [Prevotella sp.]|nr:HAMP domain-containing protein [Prevotella sp.]